MAGPGENPSNDKDLINITGRTEETKKSYDKKTGFLTGEEQITKYNSEVNKDSLAKLKKLLILSDTQSGGIDKKIAVLHKLASAGGKDPSIDPIVSKLEQAYDLFKRGEFTQVTVNEIANVLGLDGKEIYDQIEKNKPKGSNINMYAEKATGKTTETGTNSSITMNEQKKNPYKPGTILGNRWELENIK